jgi:hypothetical protein
VRFGRRRRVIGESATKVISITEICSFQQSDFNLILRPHAGNLFR